MKHISTQLCLLMYGAWLQHKRKASKHHCKHDKTAQLPGYYVSSLMFLQTNSNIQGWHVPNMTYHVHIICFFATYQSMRQGKRRWQQECQRCGVWVTQLDIFNVIWRHSKQFQRPQKSWTRNSYEPQRLWSIFVASTIFNIKSHHLHPWAWATGSLRQTMMVSSP